MQDKTISFWRKRIKRYQTSIVSAMFYFGHKHEPILTHHVQQFPVSWYPNPKQTPKHQHSIGLTWNFNNPKSPEFLVIPVNITFSKKDIPSFCSHGFKNPPAEFLPIQKGTTKVSNIFMGSNIQTQVSARSRKKYSPTKITTCRFRWLDATLVAPKKTSGITPGHLGSRWCSVLFCCGTHWWWCCWFQKTMQDK